MRAVFSIGSRPSASSMPSSAHRAVEVDRAVGDILAEQHRQDAFTRRREIAGLGRVAIAVGDAAAGNDHEGRGGQGDQLRLERLEARGAKARRFRRGRLLPIDAGDACGLAFRPGSRSEQTKGGHAEKKRPGDGPARCKSRSRHRSFLACPLTARLRPTGPAGQTPRCRAYLSSQMLARSWFR